MVSYARSMASGGGGEAISMAASRGSLARQLMAWRHRKQQNEAEYLHLGNINSEIPYETAAASRGWLAKISA